VKETPGSIGYVELIYAIQNKMSYGKVENAAGKFIKADLASVSAAAAGAAKDMPADFRVSIVDAPGATSYPISSFTWLLIPAHIEDAQKRQVIVEFLKWMLTDGQKYTEPLAYAPLPKPVVAKEMKAISLVQ
jgi:phosphate transport system substrate-binding protein